MQYLIKFVSDLRQIGVFLRVLRFPSPIKLTATFNWNIVESGAQQNTKNCSKWKKLTYYFQYIDQKQWSGLLNNLAFQSVDFEHTCWRLFQKRVVRTKYDIYVFIGTCRYIPSHICDNFPFIALGKNDSFGEGFQIYRVGVISIWTKYKYRQTCVTFTTKKKLPCKTGDLLNRFNSYAIFYARTRKRWTFNTGDCLIKVTAWASLTALTMVCQILKKLKKKKKKNNPKKPGVNPGTRER